MRLILILLVLAGCSKTPPVVPATQVQVVRETIEVQRPCRVTPPPRPAPLARPLPSDAERLAALLAAKLKEYADPDRYADRLEAALRKCTEEAP